MSTEWTPNYPQELPPGRLPLSKAAAESLRGHHLYEDDLHILLRNGAYWTAGERVFYNFRGPRVTEHGRAVGKSAGLDDVVISIHRASGIIQTVERWSHDHLVAWANHYRLTVMPDTLHLLPHAGERMWERDVSRKEVIAAIRHGRFQIRYGQIRYRFVGAAVGEAKPELLARLQGLVVVVCPYTEHVVTTWRKAKKARRSLWKGMRKSKGSRPARRPGIWKPRLH